MNKPLNTNNQRVINVAAITPAPELFLQCAIFLPGQIVGAETFRLQSFKGKDEVSNLFEYELELHGNSSESSGAVFNINEIVGCGVTVGIRTGNSSSATPVAFANAISAKGPSSDWVLFNGIVSGFTVKNWGRYQVSMKPKLHLLTLVISIRCIVIKIYVS